jgi:hypothetical protein
MNGTFLAGNARKVPFIAFLAEPGEWRSGGFPGDGKNGGVGNPREKVRSVVGQQKSFMLTTFTRSVGFSENRM